MKSEQGRSPEQRAWDMDNLNAVFLLLPLLSLLPLQLPPASPGDKPSLKRERLESQVAKC